MADNQVLRMQDTRLQKEMMEMRSINGLESDKISILKRQCLELKSRLENTPDYSLAKKKIKMYEKGLK